jgi:nitrite reductase/ring-hydroxylating ferredoxin subunit
MGGPIAVGDIEDFMGDTVITCPWHSYKISLSDGSKYFKPVTFDPITKVARSHNWEKATECSQRVHETTVDSEGNVSVTINTIPSQIPSDHYALNPDATTCLKTNKMHAVHSRR